MTGVLLASSTCQHHVTMVETRERVVEKKPLPRRAHGAGDATCAAAACRQTLWFADRHGSGGSSGDSFTFGKHPSLDNSCTPSSSMARYAVLLVVAALAGCQLAQVGRPSLPLSARLS